MTKITSILKNVFEAKYDAKCKYTPIENGESLSCTYKVPRNLRQIVKQDNFTVLVADPKLDEKDLESPIRSKFKPRYDLVCHENSEMALIICDGPHYYYNFVYNPETKKIGMHQKTCDIKERWISSILYLLAGKSDEYISCRY